MKMPPRRNLSFLLSLVLLPAALSAQTDASGTLTFQSGKPWSPRTNINADTVLVYGIDDTTAARIQSWRQHGYHVSVMTGVAWGRYAPYLRGDFDGKQHWNETQQEKSGKLILHSGREVPYISPSEAYGRYLAQGVEKALDAGAEAIYLEEPEFWARAGWSDSFKQSWQEYYHEPWQAPDSSPDAQYRASKLKYYLYRRALAQVFDAVKQYAAAHHRTIPCYVATHSLINYAQWQIVSPESSLLNVGADGYIAQVWTGTSRTPNVYGGITKQRTFETAFLEYGALQNIARSSGKRIWYLNDPIEDNPRHSWTDYRSNWESTLVASLLQPKVARYEVLPWPERIFGDGREYPTQEPTDANPNPPKAPVPETYATELQTVFHALAGMDQSTENTRWQIAGTDGIGVLVSDTLMFQRAAPEASDFNLGQFYGLALPPLMHGMPVEPVQIESTYQANGSDFLKRYKILMLTYDGQKPPSPKFHAAIAEWVRNGGALIVLDDDKDPYNKAKDWWNSNGDHFATPREPLFQSLGLDPQSQGLHKVGKGFVLYQPQSPAALTYQPQGADQVMEDLKTSAKAIHLPLHETDSLVLRRGPYVIVAGLDKEASATGTLKPVTLSGSFIDLFDASLPVQHKVEIRPGTRALLLDLNAVHASQPKVIAAAGKIEDEQASGDGLTFKISGIDRSQSAIRILAAARVQQATLDGKPLDASQISQEDKTVVLRFTNSTTPQTVQVRFGR